MPLHRRGFTLVEMLVVMGIIVIAIAMAVPAIKYLTGSKSEEAAQNAVAAMLARARTDAVALQQPQGVLFTIDQTNDRVTLYQVVQSPTLATDPPGITYLDLTPDRDPLLLPPGVRAWTILDTFVPSPVGAYRPPFLQYRYLGFNNDTGNGTYTGTAVTDKALLGGVILFDGQGNLLVTRYGFRFVNTTVTPNVPTALSGIIFTSATPSPAPPNLWPPPTSSNVYLRSQVGFVLFDKDAFQSQQTTATNKDGNDRNSNAEQRIDGWLDQNTTPLLVNRDNGTLTRAE